MKDQLHRDVHIDEIPSRIVCLVPSLTEMLVDLGLENRLVGVTKFCVHPDNIRNTAEIIGGTKTIKIDKIEGLSPDFILANKEENNFDDIMELSKRFPVYVSDINKIEDLIELIKKLSQIFKIYEEGNTLIENIQSSFIKFRKNIEHQPKLRVAYFIWRDPWMVAASSTFIDYMLGLNNFENVYRNLERYPEVDIHNLNDVDYVLLSSEPFPFKDQHKKEFKLDSDKIEVVDGEYFSWYGSRLIKAFNYFEKLRDKL